MALKDLLSKKKRLALQEAAKKASLKPEARVKIEDRPDPGIIKPAPIAKLRVPNLVGMNAGAAFKRLQSLGMNYEIVGFKEVVPKNVAEGTVSAQSPAANTAYTLKTVVKLTINMDVMM